MEVDSYQRIVQGRPTSKSHRTELSRKVGKDLHSSESMQALNSSVETVFLLMLGYLSSS